MEANTVPQNKLERLFHQSEFNRFGLICVVLIAIGCLGGTAVGLGAILNTVTLTLVTLPTMATLSMILGVAPMKWIFGVAAFASAIDIALITFYSFQ